MPPQLVIASSDKRIAAASKGGAGMYRMHQRWEVLYGHFADYIKNIEECNAIARKRGWVEFTAWSPTTGKANVVVLMSEYPDYATYKQEEDAAQADPAFMKAWREGSQFLVQAQARLRFWSQRHTSPDNSVDGLTGPHFDSF
jgi:hypothetical protein